MCNKHDDDDDDDDDGGLLTQLLASGAVDDVHQVAAAVLGAEVVEDHAVLTQVLRDLVVVAFVVAVTLQTIGKQV